MLKYQSSRKSLRSGETTGNVEHRRKYKRINKKRKENRQETDWEFHGGRPGPLLIHNLDPIKLI